MLPTRTTNRDCCIFLSFMHEARQQKFNHARYVCIEWFKIRIRRHKCRNFRVLPGEVA